jgi:hypothetical protein
MEASRLLFKKIRQKNYRCEDWETCRSKNTKRRWKRLQKRSSKLILSKILSNDELRARI